MHGDKGRLNELFLDLLVEALIQSMTPGRLDLFHVNTYSLCGGNCLFIAFDRHEVNAEIFLDSLGHGHALEAGGKADVLSLPLDVISAEYLHCRAGQQIFKQIHHVVKIGV